MDSSSLYHWRCPGEPSAISLLSAPALPQLFDRPLPAVNAARFALLLDQAGSVVDEVVVTMLAQGGCEVACHGGAGVRQRVNACLLSHGLQEGDADPFADSQRWRALAKCAHPAALSTGMSEDHPLWARIPQILLTGPSNAGKSTLLNAWVGHQRALAGPVAGTTRDLVHAEVQCAGWNLQLTDSAGLRDTSHDIEVAGQSLVTAARNSADLVLYCQPVDTDIAQVEGPQAGDIILRTKLDLQGNATESQLAWSAEPYVDAQGARSI